MSVLTVAMFVVGYVALLAVIVAVLRSARRADDRAMREHEDLMRSMAPRKGRRFAARKAAERERDSVGRTG